MDTIVLLDLMGGVALLLWGLHMVRSGILRAFGPDLRHLLSKTFGNRFSAFGAGVALTALLQSSSRTRLGGTLAKGAITPFMIGLKSRSRTAKRIYALTQRRLRRPLTGSLLIVRFPSLY